MLGIEKSYLEPERVKSLKEFFMAGYGGFKIIGTKEQIVDGLQHLSDLGFDGTLLSWANYIDGMREFQDVTYPLVQQAGLHL